MFNFSIFQIDESRKEAASAATNSERKTTTMVNAPLVAVKRYNTFNEKDVATSTTSSPKIVVDVMRKNSIPNLNGDTTAAMANGTNASVGSGHHNSDDRNIFLNNKPINKTNSNFNLVK